MGYVHATVELSNPRLPLLEAVETQALADRGALMLCIPAALAQQLQLTQESEREVSVADGRSIRVPYVGPVKVSCQGRLCFVGALVLGDDVLLGAVPMEDMDLTINPSRQRLEPDPRSPDIPHALVKALNAQITESSRPQPQRKPGVLAGCIQLPSPEELMAPLDDQELKAVEGSTEPQT